MTAAHGPRRAGHWLVRLLVPQLVAGLWLALVPDGALFGVTQAMTLLHVATSLLSLPLLLWVVVRHARGMWPTLVTWWRRLPVALLLLALLAVTATGLGALGGGQGTAVSAMHAWAAAALAVPLLIHLLQGRQRRLALGLLVGGASAAGALALLAWRLPAPPPPAPAFAYVTRDEGLYDPAYWCGECHEGIYEEWHRSVHARTLGIREVKSELQHHAQLTQLDLTGFGALAAAPANDARQRKVDGAFPFESCVSCHSPTSFYGDDPRPITESEPPARDGVTRSFCHTLRGVRPAGDVAAVVAQAQGHPSGGPMIRAMPLYVSAPETVRRYLGQASASGAWRAVGNALIRWRPEVHRRDMHAPVLDRSEVCSGCHGVAGNSADVPVRSFADWQRSPYAVAGGAAPGPAVECQDCHMARAMTGAAVREPGTLVDWGPERPQRRTHLFLGGNVRAAQEFQDPDAARREHALAAQSVSVRVEVERVASGSAGPAEGGAARDPAQGRGTALRVRATVRNERAGHLFPTVDSNLRYAWVAMKVVDDAGRVLATTAPPQHEALQDNPLTLFRCLDGDFGKTCDTAIPPRGERTVEAVLALPEGRAARVIAEVHQAFDPEALASATVAAP